MNKMISTVVAVVALIVVVTGLTFAWYSWNSTNEQNTSITFSVASVSACVVGETPTFKGTTTLIPTSSPTNTNSYTGEILVKETCTPTLYATFLLTPTALPTELITSAFNWKLTATPSGGSEIQLATGNFSNKVQGTEFTLHSGYEHSGDVTYKLQIWLDGPTSVNNMQSKTYNLSLVIELTDETP